jgi:hypothetical protein
MTYYTGHTVLGTLTLELTIPFVNVQGTSSTVHLQQQKAQ